jgi:hypothetical protein
MTLSQHDLQHASRWFRMVVFFVAAGCLAILISKASGQAVQYDVLPVDKLIDENLEKVQREVSAYASARDLSSYSANRVALYQRYFQQYLPAKITQPDSHYMINEVMDHANLALQRAVRSQTPAAGNLMRWLYGGLKPVAMGNYQPAARINAIGFIFRLAKPPAERGGLPRPYPFVLKDMKEIYLDTSNPDGVRAAALQGLDRYVRYTPTDKIDQTSKQELTQAMTQLLESDAPVGRDEMAHAFLQRYAVNILTNLSTDASLGKQLVSISTKESCPNLIALHSAAAIANLPGKMTEGDVETKEVLMQWAKRVLRSYESELARLQSLDKKKTAARQPAPPESFLKETKDPNDQVAARPMGGMGGMAGMEMMMEDDMYGMDDDMQMDMEMSGMDMMGMMGGGMRMMSAEAKQPAEIVASRKKLNYVLQQILLGVTGSGKLVEELETMQTPSTGLMASAPAKNLEDVKKWLQAINDLAAQLNDTTIGARRDYVKALEEQIITLTALSEGKSVAKKAAVLDDPFGLRNQFNPDAEAPAEEPQAAGDAGLDALLN